MMGHLGKWLSCVWVLALPAFAEVFDDLTWRSPLAQGNILWDVVAHKQGYIAVGVRGSVVASADGTNWIVRKSKTTHHFTGVASDGNVLVAVGRGASISADDGFTWEDLPIVMSLGGSVAYGNNVFVVSENGGRLFASNDGRTWTETYVLTNSNFQISLVFGNGRFVAMNPQGMVVVSANGYDWSSFTVPTLLASLDFSDGVFVATDINSAGNGIWTSPDGVIWTKRHAMPPSGPAVMIYSATSLHGKLIAVGHYIVANDGGTNWTTQNLPEAEFQSLPNTLNRVRYGHGRAIAVGNGGSIVTSEDGSSWTSRSAGTDYWLSRAAYGNGRFVITGSSQSNLAMVSVASESWTLHSYPFDRVEGLAFGNGVFVATGTGSRSIATSTNGIDWTLVYDGEWPGAWTSVRYVTFGALGFLALGQRINAVNPEQITLVSSNSQAWQAFVTPEINGMNACAYGQGKFVAVGNAGAIAASSNGASWQAMGGAGTDSLASVAFGPPGFVAVGDNGTILHSTNGSVWQRREAGVKPNYTHVSYGGGYFVAVGATNSALSMISASKDGVHWNHYLAPVYASRLTQCAYGKASFIFAGESGNVLQSSPILPELGIQLATDLSTVVLTLKGIAGEAYRVEERTRLASDQWQAVGTYSLTNDVLHLNEPASSSQKYFRASLLTQ